MIKKNFSKTKCCCLQLIHVNARFEVQLAFYAQIRGNSSNSASCKSFGEQLFGIKGHQAA